MFYARSDCCVVVVHPAVKAEVPVTVTCDQFSQQPNIVQDVSVKMGSKDCVDTLLQPNNRVPVVRESADRRPRRYLNKRAINSLLRQIQAW